MGTDAFTSSVNTLFYPPHNLSFSKEKNSPSPRITLCVFPSPDNFINQASDTLRALSHKKERMNMDVITYFSCNARRFTFPSCSWNIVKTFSLSLSFRSSNTQVIKSQQFTHQERQKHFFFSLNGLIMVLF